ncbi:hypothetical protein LAZ67_X004806 [Cordylochernes scorpioides]|uniref:Uncharacterized protein n=1 Tax=Cordylochernes scorpioides TaxID=51811 RepID=A0ABY6LVK1_9ARAC|nr:hypothetical protein LAZ67_X004806 [Cordylochernes scorpioides]
MNTTTAEVNTILKEAFSECFQQWRHCWEKCVESQGDYFEVRIECSKRVLMSTSPAISQIVTRWSSITTAFTLAIAWSVHLVEGLPEYGSLSTNVQPSLNRLYHSHSIVMESCLNLPNGFHLAVAQFLAKIDAVALLQLFHHFSYNENLTRALNTTSLICCFASTDAIDRQENSLMRMNVHGCLLQAHFTEIHQVFAKKKYLVNWRIPPKHNWYSGVDPGGALNLRNRQHQTTLTRFRTGHLKPLKIENNNKITCPKCSLVPAAPEHILACIRCTKQDLWERPLLVIKQLEEHGLMEFGKPLGPKLFLVAVVQPTPR